MPTVGGTKIIERRSQRNDKELGHHWIHYLQFGLAGTR